MPTSTLTGGQVRFILSGTETETVGAGSRSIALANPAGYYSSTITSGTASGFGNTIASITGTANSTGSSIDLTNLVAAGIDDPLTLTSIRGFVIQETSTSNNSNYLLVGDSSGTLTNAFTAPWTLATGQERIGSTGSWASSNPIGFTVDSTHKVLKVASSSGVVSYQIDIIGTK